MLMAIDVGNTNITIGIFDEKKLVATFRLTTMRTRTSDEFGTDFAELLHYNDISMSGITDVIIASVVPNIMYSLTSAVVKYFHLTPLIVEPGVRTGVKIKTDSPRQIGADRIVDAAGAYALYGGPLIVIDYGTATTFDLIDEEGALCAVLIAPGVSTSANALSHNAAKLPEIEIVRPDTILAKETSASMQAGIFFGQVGAVEYIIERMKEESGFENIKVIATGGLGNIISQETDSIDIYNPTLTLEGMRVIYDRARKK